MLLVDSKVVPGLTGLYVMNGNVMEPVTLDTIKDKGKEWVSGIVELNA